MSNVVKYSFLVTSFLHFCDILYSKVEIKITFWENFISLVLFLDLCKGYQFFKTINSNWKIFIMNDEMYGSSSGDGEAVNVAIVTRKVGNERGLTSLVEKIS